MIKKIVIGVGVVLVTAGIAFGALYLFKQPQQPSASEGDADTPKTVLDLSKDYGACTWLDSSFIKSTLGAVASNLQAPENGGIVGTKEVGEGVDTLVSDSQICVYAFEPGGTIENGFNAGNGLTIQRIIYTNDGGPSALIEQIRSSGVTTEIEGLGDVAFYSSNTASQGPDTSYTFKVQVFEGSELTAYTLRQPSDSATFTAESGRTALTTLAKEALK